MISTALTFINGPWITRAGCATTRNWQTTECGSLKIGRHESNKANAPAISRDEEILSFATHPDEPSNEKQLWEYVHPDIEGSSKSDSEDDEGDRDGGYDDEGDDGDHHNHDHYDDREPDEQRNHYDDDYNDRYREPDYEDRFYGDGGAGVDGNYSDGGRSYGGNCSDGGCSYGGYASGGYCS